MKVAILSAIALLAAGCASTNAPEASAVAAPDIPDTDVFVGALSFFSGAPVLTDLHNATARQGYDNQPWFLPGEAAFYYVAEGASGKTDIRLFDIARGASQSVFVSPDRSEYSPKRTPDGAHLSYIQENPAGDVTKVYQRKLDGSDDGAAVAEFAPLGYYAWLDRGKALGVYYRSEPGSLYRVDVASGATTLLHENIGRPLVADPSGAHLWFAEITGDPASESPSFRVMRYDSASGAITPVFDLPEGAADFTVAFGANGEAEGVFSASGATLFWRWFRPDADWIATPLQGVSNASRVAVSSDQRWIAIVDEKAR